MEHFSSIFKSAKTYVKVYLRPRTLVNDGKLTEFENRGEKIRQLWLHFLLNPPDNHDVKHSAEKT